MATDSSRLVGLDLARFLAFFGMVIVNFSIAMGVTFEPDSWSTSLSEGMQGRAAATFVVLAGLGLGLAANRSETVPIFSVTVKRALFLLVTGLANMLIFEADILHYYAFYFLFGMLFVKTKTPTLLLAIGSVMALFMIMLFTFDYEAGWNWETYEYSGFWTAGGFVRNLFFNGWHPVFPWLAFFLFGLLLSKVKLGEMKVQIALALGGLVGLLGIETLSAILMGMIEGPDTKEIAILFSTSPIPPVPLYSFAGMAAASCAIGACLLVAPFLERMKFLGLFTPAGRMTLTLYIAHILVGMGALEGLGLLERSDLTATHSVIAAGLFSFDALVFAYFWSRFFKRGPIEMLMRKLAG
ncbi:DUF418 domain-containing protein [Kordiimonas sp. SCSIO 12603]|uniref:DUF418 domain-containing protein n=1 Tax=Kordiimonas sp. SCSIO 12603 TaxID=2829596 RepID=UPI0021084970|nr:DUF418 domain-containing protein [Kordiimonas sp. SCSIO 12603]UTW58875.1 DUF418 domain-containing protein [Kordiimonas sp. SCSIO 12603]